MTNKFIKYICSFEQFLYKLYRWVKTQEISFLVYILVFVLFFIGGLFFINKSSQLYVIFTSILVFLVLFGLVWDTIKVLVKYKSTNWGILLLFLISILLYFINIQAENISQHLISSTTGEKAQYFPVVASYFEAIFMPLAFLLILIKNFTFVTPVVAFTIIFLTMGIAIKNRWRKIFLHVTFYISAMFAMITFFGSDNEKIYESFFGTNYIPKKIIEYSYHKNTNCEDIGDVYINFLYKDKISVSNVKEIKLGSNEVELVALSNNNQNITFSTLTCVKKKIVSKKIVKE